MFANLEVSTDHLPRLDDIVWQSLHPRYARALQVANVAFYIVVLMAWTVVFFIRDFPLLTFLIVVAAVALVCIVSLIWPLVSVPRCGYALREHDMVYRQGVFVRKVTAVPFNRIQHVEVSSGPLDRRFGLGSLKLYTAGGSGGDLSVNGLPGDLAEQLRDHILGKAGVVVEVD